MVTEIPPRGARCNTCDGEGAVWLLSSIGGEPEDIERCSSCNGDGLARQQTVTRPTRGVTDRRTS